MNAFDRELNASLTGEPAGTTVTQDDLDQDAASFMAFAKAVGIAPPKAVAR